MGKQRKIEIGQTYDRLKIIEYLGVREIYGRRLKFYLCECSCGNLIELAGSHIGRAYKSCGCLQAEARRKDIAPGTQFGRLTVIERTNERKHNYYLYRCKCSCDKEILVRSDMLRNREVQSCGCLHDDLFKKHRLNAYKKNFVFNTSIPKIKAVKLQKNNTSGITGVRWHKRTSKWQVSIDFQGKTYFLGYYEDKVVAGNARKEAEKEIYGNFLSRYEEYKSKKNKAPEK